jgi:protein-disulfide isomerase
MEHQHSYKGLTIAIVFSALIMSSSVVFVGVQLQDLKTSILDPLLGAAEPAPSAPSPTAAAPTAPVKVTLASDDHVKGDKNAPVTIVEYSDFECPFCSRFYEGTLSELTEKYIDTGKVKLVYRHFPLSFHANAMPAAIASECAADQDKFWEMHDILFENPRNLTKTDLQGYAKTLGLNTSKFNTCFDNKEHEDEINAEMAEGSRLGITGTPGFLINGQKVSGAQPFGIFEAIIEEAL